MSSEAELLGERIAEMAAHLDAATHRLLTDLRDYDRSGNWYQQGFRDCAAWLSWRVGWSIGTARDRVRVAQRLGELPQIDDALRTGSVSYSKVRAMTRVATPANEETLLEDARHSTGQQLETICRKYATVVRAATEPDEDYDRKRRTVHRRELDDGMVRIEATLHPEEAALVWAALDQIARERCKRGVVGSEVSVPDSTAPQAPGAAQATGGAQARGGAQATDAAHAPGAAQAPGVAQATNAAQATGAAQATNAAQVTDAAHATGVAQATNAAQATDAAHATGVAQATNAAQTTVAAQAPGAGSLPASSEPARGVFSRADALVAMAQSVVRGDAQRRSPIELVVTVSADALVSAETATGEAAIAVFADGTCVSAETARRLACDCGVVQMTEDAAGNALSVGRKTRSIPGAIKRALLKRDACCRFPGCSNRLYVEGHHIEHWANGGETSLANLVATCSFHHRFVHEYGYRVELGADQQPRFYDRQGREVLDVPDHPPPALLGHVTLVERNAELAIEPDTNVCLWDGDRLQYGDIIDALVRVDDLAS